MKTMKERIFEATLLAVSGIGIIILFTLLYGGPSFIARKLLSFFAGDF